jgi:hypothetical protein
VIKVEEVQAAVTLVSTVFPQAMAAYQILKAIWMATNPGKTEADYLAYLQTASQQNLDDASAILKAHGYVPDGAGGWKPGA